MSMNFLAYGAKRFLEKDTFVEVRILIIKLSFAYDSQVTSRKWGLIE